MECQCSKKQDRLKEVEELEKQFEQAKSTVAYLQGAIITYRKLLKCECTEECECKK
jgi:hypothetical protein|tara:strand:- start:64 stop:231 length:168 start_codon:yes stop_codon:yes gene_type:complete